MRRKYTKVVWGLIVVAICHVFASNIELSAEDAVVAQKPCSPKFVDQSSFKIDGDTAILLTHFTRRLDPDEMTLPVLKRITRFAKEKELPLVYLHEGEQAVQDCFYVDCDPTAYVQSSIGYFEFDSRNLNHVIVAGGFYEMCLNNTVTQTLKNWGDAYRQSDKPAFRDLRITYIMDAVYGVASDRSYRDPFDRVLQEWIRKQPRPTVLMNSALIQLQERSHAWTFLSRKWGAVPPEFGLNVQYRNELKGIRLSNGEQPEVTIHYASMDEFVKEFEREKPPAPKQIELPESFGVAEREEETNEVSLPQ